MGGFEGGDEGGFWDEEAIFNPITQQKVAKKDKNETYVAIKENLYALRFVPSVCAQLVVEPYTELQSVLDKAYGALLSYTQDGDIEEFFCNHKVVFEPCDSSSLQERSVMTPTEAFLFQTRDACSLCLTPQELEEIARKC